jgi:AbrB family looped-hinge helix DNA binding protein
MKAQSQLSSGRVVIPAALRAQLDMREGDQLIWRVDGDQLVVTTRRAQLRKAQAMFRQVVPPDAPSVVDELIAERRAEAARE